MANQYDLIVVGGGSGGVRAARLSALYGARVALVEEFRMGGTCVIRGCIPKKLYAYSSRFPRFFDVAPSYGWTVSASFDWPTLRANKDGEIARLEAAYEGVLVDAGVTIFKDRAVLTGPESVVFRQAGNELTADRILIATGGQPSIPEIEGRELGISSNEAFDLPDLPKSMLIVGGGYVATEFASIFDGFGVKVTVAYRRERILRGFDMDLRLGITEALKGRGVDFLVNTEPTRLSKGGEGIVVSFAHGYSASYGAVLFATGRDPNTGGLGLDKVGVLMNARGAIEVDEWSRSSIGSIYAVGDVTDRVALTPVAIREGAAFAETTFSGNPTVVDHRVVPTAIFSDPEVATVGLSEEDASLHHDEIDVYVSRFRPMFTSMTGRPERVMMKLVVDHLTGKVLGVHMLGRDAAEIVQMAAIPVSMGATKADFDRAIAIHPTSAEELVTLKKPSYRLTKGKRL